MALFNKSDYDQQGPNTSREDNEESFEFKPASTEEERLNVKLDQLDGELTSLYAQVGKDYYEQNIDNPQDEEMTSLFQGIADKKEEVERCTGQLRTLKGITTCKHCGADILVTDMYCANCGERNLSEITIAPDGGKCPNCGDQVSPGQQYCSTCGAKVNVSETAAPEESEPENPAAEETAAQSPEMEDTDFEKTMVWTSSTEEPAVEEPAAEEPAAEQPAAQESAASGTSQSEPNEPTAFCTNCGSPLEPGDIFCINCGHKVGE